MHKTGNGKNTRLENQDLNVTLKTMKTELERVEAENKSNRKKGLEIVRKLKEWRKEATYWKQKCSKLGVTSTPAKSQKENTEKSNSTPLTLATNRKAITPISISKSKAMVVSGISSPIRVMENGSSGTSSSGDVSTPSSAGWSKPLVNVRSSRRSRDTPKSVAMRG